MTQRSVLQRLRHAWREYGPAVLVLVLLSKVLHKVSGGRARIVPYVIVAQPIGRPSAGVRPDPATVTARIGRHDPICAEFPREAAIVQARFDRGAECFVTRHKGGFAGHIWLSRDRYVEDEVRCTYLLPAHPRCVWDFDVYVGERFRLGRTMARMWAAVDETLALEGVAWTFSRISMFNPGSLSSHRRLGAVPTGAVVFVVFGAWQWVFRSRWPWLKICPPGSPGPDITLVTPTSPADHPARAASEPS